MRWIAAFVTGMVLAVSAQASEIIGALSQNRVSLTADFSGSEILIFGAIRHGVGDYFQGNHLRDYDVIIAIEGPRETVQVWRRERVLGIWMNTEQVTLGSVPSFYAVATTAPLSQIITPETDAQHRISAPYAVRADEVGGPVDDPDAFARALLRIRANEQQFQALDRFVWVDDDILFRARVSLPATLTEGAYTTRMFLIRDGVVEHQFRTAIFVRKDGIERFLYQLAHEQPLAYGIMALLIALIAGWGAQAVFTLIRQR